MQMSQLRNKAPYAIWVALVVFVIGFGGSALFEFIAGSFAPEDTVQVDQNGLPQNIVNIDDNDIDRDEFIIEVAYRSSLLPSLDQDNNVINSPEDPFRLYSNKLYYYSQGPYTSENLLDETLELFQNKAIIESEANILDITPTENEANNFLKYYPPIEFQNVLKYHGLFIEKNGEYDFGETFTDCDKIETDICVGSENWDDEIHSGDNQYNDGEPYEDGSNTQSGVFDLNAYKNAFGTKWIPKELENYIENYNRNLLNPDGGNGITTNLVSHKLKFLYDQLIYVSENRVIEKINNDNNDCSINLLIADLTKIEDKEIVISDKEIEDYYNKNKTNYKIEENVTVEYVMFNRITGSLDDVRLNDIQNNKAKDFASYADTYGFDEALVMYPNLLVTVRDTLDTSIIPFEGNFFQTKDGKNRVDGLADTLLTESSVNEYLALKPVYSSSLYITEGLDRSKSGIPTEWSARNRDIVSFVFNHNRNNLTTSIFETQSGNVVMNIKQENESSFIEIDEVREEIYNILVKEEKEAYAIKIINDLLDNNDTLDNINDNSFISIYKDIEGKVSSNLTVSTEYNSGINYEIMGCINSMNSGDISYIINTKNNDSENDLLYVIELKNKTIVTTDSLIASNQTTSKNNLYNRRKNGSIYNSWLVYNRDNQEVKLDMRHKIY